MFQSTRPRGRTRHNLLQNYNRHNVSIHASSREDATIQAPKSGWQYGFNPRVLAGGRDGLLTGATAVPPVSIHASSREDATKHPKTEDPLTCFNPRVLAGGRDRLLMITEITKLRFNPRVLAGGRDCECRKQYKSKCYICKSAKEIILIINEEQYHFS